MVKSGPGLGDGGGIGQHADGSLDLGEISTWDYSGRLVVDANLEPSWTPVYELDRSLALDGGNSSINIFGDHIPPVEHAAGHVLAMTRIALHHRVGRLETGVGNLRHRQLLVVRLFCRDDGSICDEREMNSWIRNQVSLKLVEIGVGWSLNVKIPSTDVVDRF